MKAPGAPQAPHEVVDAGAGVPVEEGAGFDLSAGAMKGSGVLPVAITNTSEHRTLSARKSCSNQAWRLISLLAL
jgi:hypothetical protein